MSEPFLAEIRMAGFNFAPRGYAKCDGQLLPINQYQALYSLLGTTYGGDGRTTFALPELRGRAPTHVGSGFVQGQRSGQERVAITAAQTPPHLHTSGTGNQATSTDPEGNVLASRPRRGARIWASGPGSAAPGLLPETRPSTGGGQAHENMQPSAVVNFIIALQGIFPSRN